MKRLLIVIVLTMVSVSGVSAQDAGQKNNDVPLPKQPPFGAFLKDLPLQDVIRLHRQAVEQVSAARESQILRQAVNNPGSVTVSEIVNDKDLTLAAKERLIVMMERLLRLQREGGAQSFRPTVNAPAARGP